jgi:hypothetical protein
MEPLATVSEVFSFAQTLRIKIYMVAGCCFAALAGLCFPGKATWLHIVDVKYFDFLSSYSIHWDY